MSRRRVSWVVCECGEDSAGPWCDPVASYPTRVEALLAADAIERRVAARDLRRGGYREGCEPTGAYVREVRSRG